MGKVALITGGNGITGSAILTHLVKTTTKEEWSEIVVTSRSPFKTNLQDPRIKFVALDFNKPINELVPLMREPCQSVTHAYFSSYIHKDDFNELNRANEFLFETFLQSLIQVAPNLQNCTLQTGGKYYNLHLHPISSPATEEDPRLNVPENNFYYPQEDCLTSTQAGQTWTWNIIRPEGIIGTTPKPNGMNSALTYALYFLVCKELDQEAAMPTNQLYFRATEDCSDASLLAEFSIWASTTPACANQAFNFVNGDHYTCRYMWPRLAAYFGAKASPDQVFRKPPPKEGELQLDFSLAEWAADKRPVWDRLCEKAGLPQAKATWEYGTWQFQDWVFQRTWSATLSFTKARKFGWTGYKDSYESISGAFDGMRELGQIP